jgi:hypothetical protein
VEPKLFASTERSPLTREVEGGYVVVEATPLHWPPVPDDDLSFQVALNTHSVDLSYELSQMSTLRASDGSQVNAHTWDTPAEGGHHVMGVLTFPPLMLANAQWVELEIRDVASVPVRSFHWDATDFQ